MPRINNAENFGFIEKKYTDFEKKIIIGADDYVFETYLYLPTDREKPYKTIIMNTALPKNEFPYEEINGAGYGVAFFRPEFLSEKEPPEEEKAPMIFIRIADYLSSSDAFDIKNVIFAGKGSEEAFLSSDKAVLYIESDSLTDIMELM